MPPAPRHPTAPLAANGVTVREATISPRSRPTSRTWQSLTQLMPPRGRHNQTVQRLPHPGQELSRRRPNRFGLGRSQGVGWTASRCNTQSGCLSRMCHLPQPPQTRSRHQYGAVRGEMPHLPRCDGPSSRDKPVRFECSRGHCRIIPHLPGRTLERMHRLPHASRPD